MRRAFLYTAGFTVMMLIASLDFLFFVDRLLPLRGKVLPFLVSLSMVFLGGYVAMSAGKSIGLNEDEIETMALISSISTGMLLMLFFLF
ncbi:hypothetical protein [Thermococcus sp.]